MTAPPTVTVVPVVSSSFGQKSSCALSRLMEDPAGVQRAVALALAVECPDIDAAGVADVWRSVEGAVSGSLSGADGGLVVRLFGRWASGAPDGAAGLYPPVPLERGRTCRVRDCLPRPVSSRVALVVTVSDVSEDTQLDTRRNEPVQPVASNTLQCRKQHDLEFRSTTPEYYIGSIMCDACRSHVDVTIGFGHCRECRYDLCRSCIEAAQAALDS